MICAANESAHSEIIQGCVITGAERRFSGFRVCSDSSAQLPRNLDTVASSFASDIAPQSHYHPAPVQPLLKAFGLLMLVVLALVLPSVSFAEVPLETYEVSQWEFSEEAEKLIVVSVGAIAFFLGWIAGASA